MLTASEVIERVKARYAGCRTYQDEGTITKWTIDEKDPTDRSSETKRFQSAFERPSRLIFSFTDESARPEARFATGGVVQDARGARSWFGKAVESDRPVSSAELELAGTCPQADPSTHIPFTFLGLMPHLRLQALIGPSAVEFTALDGVRMLVLHDPAASKRLWVDEQSWMVVRFDSISHTPPSSGTQENKTFREMLERPDLPPLQRKIIEGAMRVPARPYRTEKTTIWRPRMDHAIDPKVFEFVPPG